MKDPHYSALRAIDSNLKAKHSLTKLNSYRIKTKAQYYSAPEKISQIIELIQYCKSSGIPFYVLGGGTNVLLSDLNVHGVVIHMKHFTRMSVSGKRIIAQSGVDMSDLSQFALRHKFTGLEWCYGLPGTLGGATCMNARCYGSEIADNAVIVRYIDEDLRYTEAHREELDFAYKKSPFQNGKRIIIEVVFKLEYGESSDIKHAMMENYADRKKRKQFVFASAGCVFTNNRDFGMPTGQIIDSLGMRGLREGGAKIANFHANFIINDKRAKARDIYLLMRKVQAEVKEKKGIMLAPEIRLMGDW